MGAPNFPQHGRNIGDHSDIQFRTIAPQVSDLALELRGLYSM